MTPVRIAAVGSNGHQIVGLMPDTPTGRLVAVAEFDAVRAAQWEQSTPDIMRGANRFESLEEVLVRSDCELVSLCSGRRDKQADQIVACLGAGRHVLAEKPLCTTLEDLARIRAAAAANGRQVWAMLTMVYTPVFREIEQRIRGGELGEIGQIFAQKSYKYGGNRPQDRGIDGGIIQSAIHAISFVRSTTHLEFVEVAAVDSAVGNRVPGQLQIEFAVTARMHNGALCQILANYLNPDSFPHWGNDQLRLFGTRGMIEATDALTRTAGYAGGQSDRGQRAPEHVNYLPDLLAELQTGVPAYLTMEDSFRATEIAIEAQMSASNGGVWRRLSREITA